jgi:hypothetical protein
MNSRTPVHITQGSGKMENICSVNVSSLQNEFCKQMSQQKNTVCGKCYSNRYSKLRPTLEKRILENSDLLSTRLLEPEEVPLFNARYVRFNSFGEIINEIHYLNLIQIANSNPHTTFGLWTKRSNIVMRYPKEPNIKYIFSPLGLEKPKLGLNVIKFFDKVFMVHKKDSSIINCKGKCIDCLLCYTDNDTKFIHEKLK